MQKGQTHTVGYAVRSRYAVGVSAKRSNPTQYAVGVSGKRSYGWWGLLPLVQKGQSPHSGYAVHSRYAVGVSAKRSIHTVDLANIGSGNCYL